MTEQIYTDPGVRAVGPSRRWRHGIGRWARACAAASARVGVGLDVVNQGLARLQELVAARVLAIAAPVGQRTASWIGSVPVPGRARRLGAWLVQHASPEWAVAGTAAILSVGFYAWYVHSGLTLAYTDAVSHLMIARRVVAGRTPGIAQLGTNWLPLHHLLMTPLIWIDMLFRNGFAGAFPSMVAYVVSAVYLFRTGRLLFTSSVSGWMVAFVFMFNPNMLYMQGTALSESDLLCTSIVAVYYLLQWSHFYRVVDLVKAAATITAATLVRYEGWALVLGGIAVVTYVAWRRHGRVGAEARVLLFGVMASAGCAGWLFYNWLLFHDPLEFLRGKYSAAYQQHGIEAAEGLPTHNDLWLSLHVYTQTIIDTAGWPIALLALLGLAYWVIRYRLRAQFTPAYLLLIPFAFNVYALVRGISIIETPEIGLHEPTYFNVRYAVGMIPAIALFLAPTIVKRRVMLIAVLGLVVSFCMSGSVLSTPYVLGEPLHGVGVAGRILGPEAGKWLATHYHGGYILISYAPDSNVMFYSGLPDDTFITDSNGPQFERALADPQDTVEWIVVTPIDYDPVWATIGHRQDWRQYFTLVQVFGGEQIYERIGST
jgi:hypothetical protein